MTRTKLGLLGLCAVVVGMMATSASSAQAAGCCAWLVLNEKGTTNTLIELKEIIKEKNAKGEEIELRIPNLLVQLNGEKDTADITLLTHEVNIKFAVTCTGFELIGIHLAEEGKLLAGGKVKFTGCEAYGKGILEEPLGCKVHSSGQAAGTVLTGEGKGEIVLHERADKTKVVLTKLEPLAGSTGTFASFLTEGCVIPEANPVHGALFVEDCEGKATTHAIKHLIVQGPLTSLWVGADTVEHLETSIDGSAWIFLGGEHLNDGWAAMDPA